MKYIKRRKKITADQFNGSLESALVIADKYPEVTIDLNKEGKYKWFFSGNLRLDAQDRILPVYPTEWIVRETNGEIRKMTDYDFQRAHKAT